MGSTFTTTSYYAEVAKRIDNDDTKARMVRDPDLIRCIGKLVAEEIDSEYDGGLIRVQKFEMEKDFETGEIQSVETGDILRLRLEYVAPSFNRDEHRL